MREELGTADGPLMPMWDKFVDEMRTLPEWVLGRFPERLRDDPAALEDLCWKMLAGLAYGAFDILQRDGDYPVFRPGVGRILNFGQPNADTQYRLAVISPGGTYRLRGRRGSARVAIVAQRGPFPCEPGGDVTKDEPGASLAHHDINLLAVDDAGWFDVILSPARPDGHTGDWWPLLPRTNKLWLRSVKADWANEVDPTMSIERLDVAPGGRPRPTVAELRERMRWLGPTVALAAGVELMHIENMRRDGFLNGTMTYYDTSEMVGLENQRYFECAYELADDEALIVEAKIPEVCQYWSVMLTDEAFRTIDWHNNHSCLNIAQARVDGDGVARFVISARDPGVPNWLDTAGHRSGQFQGRWYQSRGESLPTGRKVRFDEVRDHLPSDTPVVGPEQRDAAIRERRLWLQQSRFW